MGSIGPLHHQRGACSKSLPNCMDQWKSIWHCKEPVDGEHVWTTLLWFRCGVPSTHMTGFEVIRPNPEAAHRFWQTLSHCTLPSGSLRPPSHFFCTTNEEHVRNHCQTVWINGKAYGTAKNQSMASTFGPPCFGFAVVCLRHT